MQIKESLREALLDELGVSMSPVNKENSFIGRLWDNHGAQITALINDISEQNPSLHKSVIVDIICKILQDLQLSEEVSSH